ncbi:MAG: SxtJ family membrane protein [Chthoniobacteraceae bacterium]
MINPFREINWKPTHGELRAFGKVIAFGFPIVAALLGVSAWLRSHVWPAWTLWLGAAGLAVGLACMFVPRAARPLYLAWMAVGCCIGLVVGNAVLAVIYFLIVTPIGLALRLAGRDPLRRAIKRERKSYWDDAQKAGDSERYFRQY